MKENRSSRSRSGFTLTEVLVATAIISMVVGYVGLALVSAQRIFEETMADTEMALNSRALREKIQFEIVEGEGGLMNARLGGFTLADFSGGKASKLTYRISDDQPNMLSVLDSGILTPSRGTVAWLSPGPAKFVSKNIFSKSENDEVCVTADIKLTIGQRSYSHREVIPSQILNE